MSCRTTKRKSTVTFASASSSQSASVNTRTSSGPATHALNPTRVVIVGRVSSTAQGSLTNSSIHPSTCQMAARRPTCQLGHCSIGAAVGRLSLGWPRYTGVAWERTQCHAVMADLRALVAYYHIRELCRGPRDNLDRYLEWLITKKTVQRSVEELASMSERQSASTTQRYRTRSHAEQHACAPAGSSSRVPLQQLTCGGS